jgi:hypothetical protein
MALVHLSPRSSHRELAGSGAVLLAAVLSFLLPAGELRAAAPTDILLASASIREHQAAGTIVGILRAVDADAGDPHVFSLVAGVGSTDNALFAVAGDTLVTAASFDFSTKSSLSIRLRTSDSSGATFEKPFTIAVTPPVTVNAVASYFAANPLVQAATLATFDRETLDYFWVELNVLAATGSVDLDVPAATPPETATTTVGLWTVPLSALEGRRLVAAKAAHAVHLEMNTLVGWRLGSYSAAELKGLFDPATVFDPQPGAPIAFFDIVDHSPTEAYRYVLSHGLVRATAKETAQAILDDLRSDFTHGQPALDAQAACTVKAALATYVMRFGLPARISRAGCHTSTRIALALLRALNIPGTLTVMGDYFPPGHSTAVFPALGAVMAHGDDLYSGDLAATPADQLLVPFTYYSDNPTTAPCGGSKPCLSQRYHALHGLAYPTPTILSGVKSPATYGYASPLAFLVGFFAWDAGLTAAELQQAVTTLQAGYPETRRLTLPISTAKGWILNVPAAQDYGKGSRVSLKAVPRSGYTFVRWTGDVPAGLEAANPLVLAMDVARSIQATWAGPPIIPPTPVATNNGPKCEGSSITLSTPYIVGATFAWTGPNGFTSSSFAPALNGVTPAMSGDYFVTVRIDGDTSAPGRTTVAVNPRPVLAGISAPASTPPGGSFTASVTPLAGASYAWSVLSGGTLASGQGTPSVTVQAGAAGTLVVQLVVTNAGGCVSLPYTARVIVGDPLRLGLQAGKISVKVDWKSQYNGQGGTATAIPKADTYGYFSFFDPANPEVFVKVLDFGAGSPYLLFWSGLTDFEYTVTFTNLASATSVSFHKDPGSTAGGASTTTLPHARAAAWDGLSTEATEVLPPSVRAVQGEPGPAASGEILLAGGKVGVSVSWKSAYSEESGTAVPIPQQDGFAFFTFFDVLNPEVFVKALDWGASQPYKIFAAGLTDFTYTVTYRNVATGATLVFPKPSGSFDGFAANLPR